PPPAVAEPAADAPVEGPPAAAQPAPSPGRKVRWVALALAVAVVAAAAGYITLGRRSPQRYPAAWDQRVVDLVSFVEDKRGLNFQHPVFVDFLTPGEYHKQTTTDTKALSAEDKRELERANGLLRAMGLVSGKVDLL